MAKASLERVRASHKAAGEALADLYGNPAPEQPGDEEWPDVLDYVRETTKDLEGQG
jgi:hypothetical protein